MKISEFVSKAMNKEIKVIKSGSELLLFAECQRYLSGYGERLECDVEVDSRLWDTEYACYMIESGVSVNFTSASTSYSNEFRLFSVEDVEFREVTDSAWVFNYMDNPVANKSVCSRNRSKAYVGLLAYFLVYRAMNTEKPVLHIAQGNVPSLDGEYSELIILQSYGNKLITSDILFLEMNSHEKAQPDWDANVLYHRQLGYMCREYLPAEKKDEFNSKISCGDVVLLYERSKGSSQDNKIRHLESCFAAIVEQVSDSGVTLRCVSMLETALTTRRCLDEAGGRNKNGLFSFEDYRKFPIRKKVLSWSEIGIENLLWAENYYITEVIESDGSYQDLMTEKGVQTVFLSTPDSIYAVFENRNVNYDKERFLSKHFVNKTPVYDTVRDIQPSFIDAIKMGYADMVKKYVGEKVD